MTTVQTKIYLLHFQNSLFPRLSLNIIREICSYIGFPSLFPCISLNSIYLINLHTGNFTVFRLATRIDSSWTFCLLSETRLFGLTDKKSIEIDLVSTLETLGNGTKMTRRWPGLGKNRDFVYIFGGQRVKTCEKYDFLSKIWTKIDDLHSPKAFFTPCRVNNEFFLCCFGDNSGPFEAFNLLSESFRLLPVHFSHNSSGTVAFYLQNQVNLLGNNGLLLQFHPLNGHFDGQTEVNFSGFPIYSNISPVCVGTKVYWGSLFTGNLVWFDSGTGKLQQKRMTEGGKGRYLLD